MKHTKTMTIFEHADVGTTDESLLFLIPLIEMAWAHGAISPRERRLVFDYAREDGIDERHDLNDTLSDLLLYQPSAEFYERCTELIRDRFSELTVKHRFEKRDLILARCESVAASAGGKDLMDVDHHISVEEKVLLDSLADQLNWPN